MDSITLIYVFADDLPGWMVRVGLKSYKPKLVVRRVDVVELIGICEVLGLDASHFVKRFRPNSVGSSCNGINPKPLPAMRAIH